MAQVIHTKKNVVDVGLHRVHSPYHAMGHALNFIVWIIVFNTLQIHSPNNLKIIKPHIKKTIERATQRNMFCCWIVATGKPVGSLKISTCREINER